MYLYFFDERPDLVGFLLSLLIAITVLGGIVMISYCICEKKKLQMILVPVLFFIIHYGFVSYVTPLMEISESQYSDLDDLNLHNTPLNDELLAAWDDNYISAYEWAYLRCEYDNWVYHSKKTKYQNRVIEHNLKNKKE